MFNGYADQVASMYAGMDLQEVLLSRVKASREGRRLSSPRSCRCACSSAACSTGNLGVNPAETIQLETGRWALKFLLLSLAITPVRRITGWNILIQYRRMLGLFAFFYAIAATSRRTGRSISAFAFGAMVGDVLKRPFIALGFAAFLLMVPLALTSTKGWIRRLGKKWALLHRLVYVSAICAVLHFAWKVKVFTGDP